MRKQIVAILEETNSLLASGYLSSNGGIRLQRVKEEMEFALKEIPKIVCLCGSTRFFETFQLANSQETLKGNIVLSVGSYPNASAEFRSEQDTVSEEEKVNLDELHLRKIDLADEILVLDVEDYIGESTRNEITYALKLEKTIRYWSQENHK